MSSPAQEPVTFAHLNALLDRIDLLLVQIGKTQKRLDEVVAPAVRRRDAAAYLGVSVRTLQRIVDAGELRQYWVGENSMFRRSDLDQYLANHTPEKVRGSRLRDVPSPVALPAEDPIPSPASAGFLSVPNPTPTHPGAGAGQSLSGPALRPARGIIQKRGAA